MVFNSLTFVVFFALVLALHHLPLPWRTKKLNLLVASYLFYAAWNPPFVILLWVSTVVDWYAAQKLVRSEKQNARRAWMLLSVVANLGMLSYFKYGAFLLANFAATLSAFGITYAPPAFDIVLPVGIVVLHVRDDVVHARRLSAARGARAQFPRLRAVRDLFPAPGRRSDHAADGTGAAVCAAA